MNGEYFTYSSRLDGTQIKSYFVAPMSARGGVMLLRGVAGPDSGYTEIADRLADACFAALVHTWQVRGSELDDEMLIADIESAIGFLKGRPELAGRPLAVFGYCKGGGFAVLAGARCPDIRAVVAFHGFARRPDGATEANRNPIDVVGEVKQPVLLLHGQNDTRSPVGAMRELTAALQKTGVSAEIHVYPDADHGFAVSTHTGYNIDAANDSFRRAVEFLKRHLS